MSFRVFTIPFVAVLAIAGAALSAAPSVVARSGTVSATLAMPAGAKAQLTITRGGTVGLPTTTLPYVHCLRCDFQALLPGDASGSPLVVRDLDGDGEPEVLVLGQAGGGAGDFTLGIYGYDSARASYSALVQTFDRAAFSVIDLDGDGRPEIEADDARFLKLFGRSPLAYAPPLILHYERRDGVAQFTDVTRRFPRVIAQLAAAVPGNLATASVRERRALLAGYVADEELVGHGARGVALLDRQIARGDLGSSAQAQSFRARLLRTLRALRYR